MTRLLLAQPNIHSPVLSAHGQWIPVRQRASHEQPLFHEEEIWAMKSDGSEQRRLLGPENLAALTETGPPLRLDDITWVPDYWVSKSKDGGLKRSRFCFHSQATVNKP